MLYFFTREVIKLKSSFDTTDHGQRTTDAKEFWLIFYDLVMYANRATIAKFG